MSVGLQIRKLREAKRMTLGELARRAGISKGTLSRIERGLHPSPRYSTLQQLAEALELPVEHLFGQEEPVVQGDGITPYAIAKAVQRLPASEREEIFFEILDRLARREKRPSRVQTGRTGGGQTELVALAGAV